MSVTERLMKPGRWDVSLRPDAPASAWLSAALHDHVVITPTRLDQLSGFSDSAILAKAIYAGVIHDRVPSRAQLGTARPVAGRLSGEGLAWWLGGDDGRGDVLDAAVSNTAGTLSTWISSLLPVSITSGTVTNTGTTLTYTFQWSTRREAIDWVCRAVGAEWRVNPTGTLDAAAASTLFVATPTVVITANPEGTEGSLSGIEAVDVIAAQNVDGYTTKVIVVGRSGDGAQVATGSATGSNVYKDFHNNNVVLERLVNSPDTVAAEAGNVASKLLNLYGSVRSSHRLTSRSYAVPTKVRPGDWVYVYDPPAGLVDAANQVMWRGELVSPIKLRCRAYTWPIERGMGVYLRRSGATPTYTDISDWVQWEDIPTEWEVGASIADSDLDPEQLSPAYLGVNADIINRVNVSAGILAITDNQTSTSALAAGVGTSEASTNLTTPAVATLAGRRYRLVFTFELRAGQNLTSYGTVRVRRGTNTSGTVVYGPVGISKRAGTASRDLITVTAYDAPGAQSSQQWVVTLATDASSVDVYSPSSAIVEDAGPA